MKKAGPGAILLLGEGEGGADENAKTGAHAIYDSRLCKIAIQAILDLIFRFLVWNGDKVSKEISRSTVRIKKVLYEPRDVFKMHFS